MPPGVYQLAVNKYYYKLATLASTSLRFFENDADALKHVGVLTTNRILLKYIYICCAFISLDNKQLKYVLYAVFEQHLTPRLIRHRNLRSTSLSITHKRQIASLSQVKLERSGLSVRLCINTGLFISA